jgi:hypothetical protein
MTLFGNKGRWSLNEGTTVEQFLGLRGDLAGFALGVYFAELLEAVSDEDCPSAALLRLGLNALYALSRALYPPEHIKAVFELRLLCLAGFMPVLDACGVCGAAQPERPCFSTQGGVLCCGGCRTEETEPPLLRRKRYSPLRSTTARQAAFIPSARPMSARSWNAASGALTTGSRCGGRKTDSRSKIIRTRTGFHRQIFAHASENLLQIRQYSLRDFARLDKNPLCENCLVPVGEKFSRDFSCGGRRLAGARQGQQGEKHRKGPPTGGTGSTPVTLNQR